MNLLLWILSPSTWAVLNTVERNRTSAIVGFQSKLAIDYVVVDVILNHYVSIRLHWITWPLCYILILSFKSKIIVFIFLKSIKLAFLKSALLFFILFFSCFLFKSIFRFWFVFLSFLFLFGVVNKRATHVLKSFLAFFSKFECSSFNVLDIHHVLAIHIHLCKYLSNISNYRLSLITQIINSILICVTILNFVL